jgi:succinyl-CoA synthetase alpha subunit/GNAT superfamily N-acetyltransferase
METSGSARWSAEVVLADGGPAYVRPIEPSDAEAYEAFHDRQSHESIYYRYFSARPKISHADLERIVTVDMVDRAALVAVDGEDLIGIASYDRWPGRADAEVAFFVDDGHHGRGLATVLLEHLAVVARSNGIERFTAEVLADNRAMLSVFMKAGWPVQRAFESGVIDVVFPLETTPGLVDSIERRERVADGRSLARLLFPRSVAVVGASDAPGSPGWAMFRNLLRSGFPGPVYPVNPHRDHAASVACVPNVSAVDGPVDLAVIVVPPSQVRSVVEDCAAKRVRGLVMCTDLSTAEPELDVAELVQFIRRHGMRLIGPGSMGTLVTGDAPLWAHLAYANGRADIPAGGVAISLQSGSLGASVLDLAQRLRIGISTFVSLGDKADVSGNDLLQYAEDDSATQVIAMYTESFGNPRKFHRIARRVALSKPIVAVRAGPVGDLPSVEALYQQAGVIPVASVRDLLDTARVLATQPLPTGRQVAVITNARNPAKLAVDALRRQNLQTAPLATATWDALGSTEHVVRSQGDGVLDLTWRATPADYRAALAAVLDDPSVDAVVVIHAPPVPQALEAPADVIDDVASGAGCPCSPSCSVGTRGPSRPVRPSPRSPSPSRRPPSSGALRAWPSGGPVAPTMPTRSRSPTMSTGPGPTGSSPPPWRRAPREPCCPWPPRSTCSTLMGSGWPGQHGHVARRGVGVRRPTGVPGVPEGHGSATARGRGLGRGAARPGGPPRDRDGVVGHVGGARRHGAGGGDGAADGAERRRHQGGHGDRSGPRTRGHRGPRWGAQRRHRRPGRPAGALQQGSGRGRGGVLAGRRSAGRDGHRSRPVGRRVAPGGAPGRPAPPTRPAGPQSGDRDAPGRLGGGRRCARRTGRAQPARRAGPSPLVAVGRPPAGPRRAAIPWCT